METARQVIDELNANLVHGHVHLMQFVDTFRRADEKTRWDMIQDAPGLLQGKNEGLTAATISALCREVEMDVPEWVGNCGSPEPYFVFPAKSLQLRLLLMLESPAPFHIRKVFVPENFLSRA